MGASPRCSIPTVKTVVEVDQVLVAIGQAADLSYAGPGLQTQRGMIVAEKDTAATSLEGVFAGGDVTGQAATVVQAMAAGKRAADAIDAYLAGAQGHGAPNPTGKQALIINKAALDNSWRVPAPLQPVSQRTLRGEDSQTLAAEALQDESCAAPTVVVWRSMLRTSPRP